VISIVIPAAPVDFTPRGKRAARVVAVRGRMGRGVQLRFYVAGRLFRRLAPSPANLAMARNWVSNEGAADNRPQPWEDFA